MVDITREKLFELVWSEPTTKAAKHLGISDVALGKLCRRLQVPKPPRGYWARKQSGKAVPPRAPLPAFIEDSGYDIHPSDPATRQGKRGRSQPPGPKFSRRKRELFDSAVRHLRDKVATSQEYTIEWGYLTHIDPGFAAAIVVTVGRHFRELLLPEDAGMRAEVGLEGVAGRLIDDLLPLARDQIIVFSPPEPTDPRRKVNEIDKHAVVRFTPELVRTVARLANLVREEGMAFAAHPLSTSSQFWRVRWASNPCRALLGQTSLCISKSEAWVRYQAADWFGEPYSFDTATVPLEQIAPVELLGQCEVQEKAVGARTLQEPYVSRLQALLRAEQAYEIADSAWLSTDHALDPESYTKALTLWWDREQFEALHRVRADLQDVGERIEAWHEALQQEREALCRELLGVRRGDCVSVQSRGQRVVLLLESVDLVPFDEQEELVFLLHGMRYRKDGMPGKRQGSAAIRVPWRCDQ